MRVFIVEERQGLALAGYHRGFEYEIPDSHARAYIKRGWAVVAANGHNLRMLDRAPANKAHLRTPSNK